MTQFEEYSTKYEFVSMHRESGVLEVRMHTRGGPLVWDSIVHRQFPMMLADVGADPSTRLIIFTGTGNQWIAAADTFTPGPFGEGVRPTGWNQHDKMSGEGHRILENLLAIEVPIIAAINGPAALHAELALVCDVVLAADSVVLSDKFHFGQGIVPGDGVQIVWPLLLGLNRGRYFILTQQEISAAEGLRLGLIAEVIPGARLMDRAWELARHLNAQPRLTLRYTRLVLVRQLRKLLVDDLSYGVHLEGISVAAMKSEQRSSRLEEPQG